MPLKLVVGNSAEMDCDVAVTYSIPQKNQSKVHGCSVGKGSFESAQSVRADYRYNLVIPATNHSDFIHKYAQCYRNMFLSCVNKHYQSVACPIVLFEGKEWLDERLVSVLLNRMQTNFDTISENLMVYLVFPNEDKLNIALSLVNGKVEKKYLAEEYAAPFIEKEVVSETQTKQRCVLKFKPGDFVNKITDTVPEQVYFVLHTFVDGKCQILPAVFHYKDVKDPTHIVKVGLSENILAFIDYSRMEGVRQDGFIKTEHKIPNIYAYNKVDKAYRKYTKLLRDGKPKPKPLTEQERIRKLKSDPQKVAKLQKQYELAVLTNNRKEMERITKLLGGPPVQGGSYTHSDSPCFGGFTHFVLGGKCSRK